MGTQKNRLNETVLLSTKTNYKTDGLENNYSFTLKRLCLPYELDDDPLCIFTEVIIAEAH